MKIFVAYGYNDRDKWIEKMVFPLIEAFGSEVETGGITYGMKISDAVRSKVRFSDALIGFTTERVSPSDADGQTHRWVIEELAIAGDDKKPFVEVREIAVDQQDGMTAGYQRINYDENARDKCLVEIVQALGLWHSSNIVQVQLLPKDFARDDLRPLHNQKLLTCEYVIKTGNHQTSPKTADIQRIKGGLFIDIQQPERNALIQINIKHGTTVWSSDYESLDSYGIHLE